MQPRPFGEMNSELNVKREPARLIDLLRRICRRGGVQKAASSVVMLSLAVVSILPIVLTFTNSLMSAEEIAVHLSPVSDEPANTDDPHISKFARLRLIPDMATLEQYGEVLIMKPNYLIMFWNSVFLIVPIVAGQTVVASLAAYAFAVLRFRWREALFLTYIVTMLMPFQVTLVPNFIVADKLGLIDTYLAIIGPGVFGAFGVFLLRQFMTALPYVYIEAARADGASHFYIFRKIVLPMCHPGLAALVVLLLADNWNMVEQPLIMLHNANKQPLSIYLAFIREDEWGIAFAASAVYMMPMLLVMLYAEHSFVEGIRLSGLKD